MHSKTPRILFALTLTAFCLETQAGIFGPNTSMHSGLSAASAAGPEELISSKKIIMDKLVDIHCSPPCEPDGAVLLLPFIGMEPFHQLQIHRQVLGPFLMPN